MFAYMYMYMSILKLDQILGFPIPVFNSELTHLATIV